MAAVFKYNDVCYNVRHLDARKMHDLQIQIFGHLYLEVFNGLDFAFKQGVQPDVGVSIPRVGSFIGTGKSVNIFTIPPDQIDNFNLKLYQLSDEDRTSRGERFLRAVDEMAYEIEYCSVSHYTCIVAVKNQTRCIATQVPAKIQRSRAPSSPLKTPVFEAVRSAAGDRVLLGPESRESVPGEGGFPRLFVIFRRQCSLGRYLTTEK